ncbi:hypothetical protein [Thalassotalea mangrovi]|nr:hypothetical protein [Thalassotalea mangrovi]
MRRKKNARVQATTTRVCVDINIVESTFAAEDLQAIQPPEGDSKSHNEQV